MLASMLVVLLIFTLLGMEITWGIALACFFYIALSGLTDHPTEFTLFSLQMTAGLDSFVLVSVPLFRPLSPTQLNALVARWEQEKSGLNKVGELKKRAPATRVPIAGFTNGSESESASAIETLPMPRLFVGKI